LKRRPSPHPLPEYRARGKRIEGPHPDPLPEYRAGERRRPERHMGLS
jgi:hypothetical protein